HGASDTRADFGREERELVPRQQVPAEPESQHQKEQKRARQPRQLTRFSVRLQEEDTEQVRERRADQQVRRPAVDVANQPAESHLRHDELDALVRFGGARPVVEQEQDAGEDLHAEEEQRQATEVVPNLLRVNRDALLFDEVADLAEVEAFVEPVGDAHARDTTISASAPSPRRLTTNFSRPRGGGPDTTLPPRSYVPLWHAHQSCEVSVLNCTVQSRCVQTALNARISPSAVRTTIPGLLPNLKIAAELGFNAAAGPADADCVAGSPLAGGIKNCETGYAIATAVETKPVASSASRNVRRSKVASLISRRQRGQRPSA